MLTMNSPMLFLLNACSASADLSTRKPTKQGNIMTRLVSTSTRKFVEQVCPLEIQKQIIMSNTHHILGLGNSLEGFIVIIALLLQVWGLADYGCRTHALKTTCLH